MTSAAGRPTVGRALPRPRTWGAVVSFWLVVGVLLLPALPANAASFVVTTTADAGPGSLRSAIASANAAAGVDVISFDVGGGGPQTISPLSPLPAITGAVVIDGLSQPGADCGMAPTFAIRLDGSGAGAGTNGLTVTGGTGSTIQGLTIGGFSGDGISLSALAMSTMLSCDAIGTSADGTASIGNGGAGIAVRSTGAAGTTTISGNVIRNNGGAGILVDAGARLVSIRGNRIDANGGIGIDLVTTTGNPNGDGITSGAVGGPGTGGNDLEPAPALGSALDDAGSTTVDGTLAVAGASTPANTFEVEFFASPACDAVPPPGGSGEGARSIGSILLPPSQLNGPGVVPFTATGLDTTTVGEAITATATDGFGSGNTSEFSACVPVAPATPPAGADLELTSVTNTPNPVTGGYDVGYAVVVTNLGPGSATDVTLTDTLATGESFVSEGSDPRCSAAANAITCALGSLGDGDTTSVLIVTQTPKVGKESSIQDGFAVGATEDTTPANDQELVTTTVEPRRVDFAAGYVPARTRDTWITDATFFVHGDPMATMSDTTFGAVMVPGGGPGGPVTITEGACGAPFACSSATRTFGSWRRVVGALVTITVPRGYDASNALTGVFVDNWSVVGWNDGYFRVAYRDGASGAFRDPMPSCRGRDQVSPPCVASIGRIHDHWNPYADSDLLSVVRFIGDATFGRER